MKKILAVVLFATLILSGCAGGKSAKKDDTAAKKSDTAFSGNDELSKYVTLSDYKNLSVDWTEGDAKSLYDSALESENATTKKITDRKIKTGDIANIDYTGYYNGKAFDGGTAEGYDLTIGSGQFIDGFESGLIGKMPGTETDLNLTFPKAYNGEMAGKSVVFKVKINYITEKTYTDEQIANAKKSVFGRALLYQVLNASSFKDNLPSEKLKSYNDLYTNYYTNYAVNNGYGDLSKFLAANNTTSSQFESLINERATEQLKLEIILSALAKKENITISKDEYNSAISSYAAANSCTVSELLQNTTKESIETSLMQDKAEEFLASNSTLK